MTDKRVENLNIESINPLITPDQLKEEMPVSDAALHSIQQGRQVIRDILDRKDHRIFVVIGPCSIHDTGAALEYADLLHAAASRLQNDLFVIMRVYFEKPRTTVGWKGLINDPHLDGSFDINTGLRRARKLLVDLAERGIPAGSEFLDVITPQFIADLISWGAIGARTTESQIHRELASGMSMPIGFKNGTDGNIQIAMDAIGAARHPHHFLSVTKQGSSAIVETCGNSTCHLILRGATTGPNYDSSSIAICTEQLGQHGLCQGILVDCSHGNSKKDYTLQPVAAHSVAEQVSSGVRSICGVMLESHLKAGNQKQRPNQDLVYGQSITDACMAWEMTEPLLDRLASAVRLRRQRKSSVVT